MSQNSNLRACSLGQRILANSSRHCRLSRFMPRRQSNLTLRTSRLLTYSSVCKMNFMIVIAAILALLVPAISHGAPGTGPAIKIAGFKDPHTGYIYRVASYPSQVRVSRYKLSPDARQIIGQPENVQKINFLPSLVDFDLHCPPTHCYMVAVTNKTRQNIELYSWQRTQFDKIDITRDSFSRPTAVKIFRIYSAFYIVVAQEQLHLSQYQLSSEIDELPRFVGCAVLKFSRGHEKNLKYHQFIKLPVNPRHVSYFTSINSNNLTNNAIVRPTESHHLLFSVDPNWADPGAAQTYSFIWSPVNDYFWPYRLPRGAEFSPKPGTTSHIVRFPSEPARLNMTQMQPDQVVESVEMCFHHLQRLLADRDIQARKLISASEFIWKLPQPQDNRVALTNVSAQVIVHGNVIVKGYVIESPQISLIGGQRPPIQVTTQNIKDTIAVHSPALVDSRLKRAFYKLNYIRDKLSRAIMANMPSTSLTNINNQLRVLGGLRADEVILKGVANSDARLNGIPFNQLEHELVSLIGSQNIGAKVVFEGRVFADLLEIHATVNDNYLMKDAVDIASERVQILDTTGQNYILRSPNMVTMDFHSVSAPEMILSHEATFNDINLGDFITKDNRTQMIFGRKSFQHLAVSKLDLADANVLLNGFNLSRVASSAVYKRGLNGGSLQVINGEHVTFTRPVVVDKLTISNNINQHINISQLIHDSVKVNEVMPQQITGHKNFLSPLRIGRLSIEGSINGVHMSQVFNLNPAAPTPDFVGSQAASQLQVPVSGSFAFSSPVTVQGNLNVGLINDIDVARRAVRRARGFNQTLPQIVRGRKIFVRPVRVLDGIKLIDQQQLFNTFGNISLQFRPSPPLINGVDTRLINVGLSRLMQNPPVIYIDNLEIDGNLYLPISAMNRTGNSSQVTMGDYTNCPLDLIRSRRILGGVVDQQIETPVRISSLRARSVQLGPMALNGHTLPDDFVLRSLPAGQPNDGVELVHGSKTFAQMIISPSLVLQNNFNNYTGINYADLRGRLSDSSVIIVDRGSQINSINHDELQAFVMHEKQMNSTGERVLQTLNVYGNIYAKRINNLHWPDDILLKSISGVRSNVIRPQFHRRIYSPLVFTESSQLDIENQLVLRGPIQLQGRLNGVNLTEFAYKSATYGDKDLLSMGRPIRNKIFVGGITVKGELRSQGLIDGVKFDEFVRRAVTIGPKEKKIYVMSPKIFMSDTTFLSPVVINYLNDMPMENLRRIHFLGDNRTIRVTGKKLITGALRINKNLIVRGLINGNNFFDLKARAISLNSPNEIQFNKTLTVDGDIYLDNLLIDKQNGMIDGIKLTSLRPVDNRRVTRSAIDSIQFERRFLPYKEVTHPLVLGELRHLRETIGLYNSPSLVVGFIDALNDDISAYQVADTPLPAEMRSNEALPRFSVLDQIDFSFQPAIYHLAVGISRDRNTTTVYSSFGEGRPHQMSVLPIESPNAAMFLKIPADNTLFLLMSQDNTIYLNDVAKCPRFRSQDQSRYLSEFVTRMRSIDNPTGGMHVYLFHALQNSSSLTSAYFDLYQTIDLPVIDSFENFNYRGSTYALAVSTAANRIYLLLLRGYTGFQVVSYMDAPLVERVNIMYDFEQKPILVIHQTNGLHRLMESVIV